MNRKVIKLPFGLDVNNLIVSIADVKRGKCNLKCPSCLSPLVAIKGKHKQHHFRHAHLNECEGGLESAIHLAAKQLIRERKEITLPEYILSAFKIDPRGKKHIDQKTVVQQQMITFDCVQEEKELYGMKADILAGKSGKNLIIEIFYQHKVDEEKLEKIIKANISAIEINLSELNRDDVRDLESLWSYINDSQHICWLHNVKLAEYNQKLEIALEKKILEQEEKYKQEEISKIKAEKMEKEWLMQGLDKVKILSSKESIEQYKRDAKTHRVWKKYRRYLPYLWNELPDFLNIEVPDGDWIFGCDRRIWQIALYGSLIGTNRKLFSIKNADDLLQIKMEFKIHYSVRNVAIFGKKYPHLVPADISGKSPSSWKTLQAYFNYLCELGMLEFSPGYNNYWIIISKIPTM